MICFYIEIVLFFRKRGIFLSNNAEYIAILSMVKENAPNSLELDLNTIDSGYYSYLITKGYIHGAKVETYMSGATVYGASVFLTNEGECFLQNMIDETKPIRMTKKNQYFQSQIFLQRVDSGERDLTIPNERVKEQDYYDLITQVIKDKLVKGLALKYASNKPYILRSEKIRVTAEGYEIMENDYKENKSESIGTTFNFNGGDFTGAQIGNSNTQNNHYGNTLKELQKYVDLLSENDKKQATKIVEIVNSTEVNKMGALRTFSGFLEKHPRLVELTGKLLVWGMTQTNI